MSILDLGRDAMSRVAGSLSESNLFSLRRSARDFRGTVDEELQRRFKRARDVAKIAASKSRLAQLAKDEAERARLQVADTLKNMIAHFVLTSYGMYIDLGQADRAARLCVLYGRDARMGREIDSAVDAALYWYTRQSYGRVAGTYGRVLHRVQQLVPAGRGQVPYKPEDFVLMGIISKHFGGQVVPLLREYAVRMRASDAAQERLLEVKRESGPQTWKAIQAGLAAGLTREEVLLTLA